MVLKNILKRFGHFLFFSQKKQKKHSTVRVCINFTAWKRPFFTKCFNDADCYFLPIKFNAKKFERIVQENEQLEIYVWGYPDIALYEAYIKEKNLKCKIYRVEDGFIRSVGLGAAHILPLSFVVDSRDLYFNKKPNDLRDLLNYHSLEDFEKQKPRVKSLIDFIIKNNISKYNFKDIEIKPEQLYGKKQKKRILVIGQVETDASIKYGMDFPMNNNDLVQLAYEQNPDAEIFYKPHPDVLNGFRKKESDPYKVKDIATIIEKNIPLAQSFETIDHVYTMTSLSGFEALLRGIEVTVAGRPFYAGYGLTNDLCEFNDRLRKLTVEEMFFIVYLIYPRYCDDTSGFPIEIEDALNIILERKKALG